VALAADTHQAQHAEAVSQLDETKAELETTRRKLGEVSGKLRQCYDRESSMEREQRQLQVRPVCCVLRVG